ncbi:MAG: hypothetical protein IJ777_03425 [Clostridia bacterium]|nr:hypothetical protein [Clostridia bacterium]
MQKQIVEQYIENVLHNRLKEFQIKEKYILKIDEYIKRQMYSLIFHWNDLAFRKAILITAMEEAKFYEPKAELDIKCFVVVTIRNSIIEQVFSTDYSLMELDKPLNEKFVKLITMDAIEYFKNVNFTELSSKISKNKIEDQYGKIVAKYPIAWNALIQLGQCKGKKIIYEKINVKEKITIEDFEKIDSNSEKFQKKHEVVETQSGIDGGFSQNLIKLLSYTTKSEGNIFYVDCFKMATRNFEKLLKIIEILLENGDYFLTSNYLLTDSYVGKRENIYKASHGDREAFEKMKNEEFFFGISKFHRTILKNYCDYILSK